MGRHSSARVCIKDAGVRARCEAGERSCGHSNTRPTLPLGVVAGVVAGVAAVEGAWWTCAYRAASSSESGPESAKLGEGVGQG